MREIADIAVGCLLPSEKTVSSQPPPVSGSLVNLCAIAGLHQIPADPATLAHQLGLTPSDPVDVPTLLRAAKQLGLHAKLSRPSLERLPLTPLPALVVLKAESGERTAILGQCDPQRVLLQDPCERCRIAGILPKGQGQHEA